MILLLLACPAPDSTPPPAALQLHTWESTESLDAHLTPLDTPRLARRMSLDLRGELPTTAELDAVEADPAQLGTIRDGWLDDPAFEERFVDVLGQRWLTEVDDFLIEVTEFPAVGDPATIEYAWERSVGQEPLRLMARIVTDDRPWTDAVTADTTMADELLAASWPVDYPAGTTGWQEVHYADGRPAAGVLSTNGLWWRYYTTFTNYNRARVAAVARLLLCVDYLSRPVSLDGAVALGGSDGLTSALTTDPYCLGCHASVDPVASTLFGFWTPNQYSGEENVNYHPERELMGPQLMGVEPAWYGAPVDGLADLGRTVAADPRFERCAVQSMAEVYWHRDTTVDDFDRIEALRQVYRGADARLKPVIAAVTDTPSYRAAVQSGTGPAEATARLMDVTLLRRVLSGLTGFSWGWQGYDQLDNDTHGYRILGGGVDGAYVTRVQDTPGLTWERVLARTAEAFSTAVVAHDLDGTEAPWLLDRVDGTTGSTNPEFATQLAALRWRLLAERADTNTLADDADLFVTLGGDDGNAATAWAGVLQALLRDPDFVSW